MVFGVFDGFHEGHEAFLKEARSLGDYLIAVLAQDHLIRHLAGKEPAVNFVERFQELQEHDFVDEVAIGDFELEIWRTVARYRPDVIAFASDQELLEKNLARDVKKLGYVPRTVRLKSFEISRP